MKKFTKEQLQEYLIDCQGYSQEELKEYSVEEMQNILDDVKQAEFEMWTN